MHVISEKALKLFWEKHPQSEGPLRSWYKALKQNNFKSFTALKKIFPNMDLLPDDFVIFDIGGNKYRLVALCLFGSGRIYIKEVMTHAEYSKEQ
jgi:mRNA interferase HigB